MGLLLAAAWRLLRLLPPGAAWRLLHSTPAWLVSGASRLSSSPPSLPPLETRLFGHKLSSPLGIAAGLDKDGRLLWAARGMGAGFHVVGSVLAKKWPGVKPRLLARLPAGATLNRLGLPSPGARLVAERLRKAKPPGLVVTVSIAGFSVAEYVEALRLLRPHAAWVEVNISCPNVEEHRSFEEPEQAEELCRTLSREAQGTPLLLKIPPTRSRDKLSSYVDIASSYCRGIVAANTMRVEVGPGVAAGLGGAPLYPTTLWMVEAIRGQAPEKLTLIAVGGVDSGWKVYQLLRRGADAVEVLSAIIHQGPSALARMAWETYAYRLAEEGRLEELLALHKR